MSRNKTLLIMPIFKSYIKEETREDCPHLQSLICSHEDKRVVFLLFVCVPTLVLIMARAINSLNSTLKRLMVTSDESYSSSSSTAFLSSSSSSELEIGWPTRTRHVTHVESDEYGNLWGLPREYLNMYKAITTVEERRDPANAGRARNVITFIKGEEEERDVPNFLRANLKLVSNDGSTASGSSCSSGRISTEEKEISIGNSTFYVRERSSPTLSSLIMIIQNQNRKRIWQIYQSASSYHCFRILFKAPILQSA